MKLALYKYAIIIIIILPVTIKQYNWYQLCLGCITLNLENLHKM